MISHKLFKDIKKNQHRIESIEARVEDIKTQPFYDMYGSEIGREKDFQICYSSMKLHLDQRQALLEQLQLEINKELNLISQSQRNVTLLKIAQYEKEDQGLLRKAAQQEQQGTVSGAHRHGIRPGPPHHH